MPTSRLRVGEHAPIARNFTESMFTGQHRGIKRPPAELFEITGIHIGGCIMHFSRLHEDDGMEGAMAHAHIGQSRYQGWICYESPVIFYDPQYEWVFWHEYAHVVANDGHTAKWRRVMRDLDQPLFPENFPRPRKPTA